MEKDSSHSGGGVLTTVVQNQPDQSSGSARMVLSVKEKKSGFLGKKVGQVESKKNMSCTVGGRKKIVSDQVEQKKN